MDPNFFDTLILKINNRSQYFKRQHLILFLVTVQLAIVLMDEPPSYFQITLSRYTEQSFTMHQQFHYPQRLPTISDITLECDHLEDWAMKSVVAQCYITITPLLLIKILCTLLHNNMHTSVESCLFTKDIHGVLIKRITTNSHPGIFVTYFQYLFGTYTSYSSFFTAYNTIKVSTS